MRIIKNGNLRILKSEENKMLKDKNDNGEVLEDGTIVPPYLTDTIYLGCQITTLEQVQELYEEVEAISTPESEEEVS